MWLPEQQHFYTVEILLNMELIQHSLIFPNMFM